MIINGEFPETLKIEVTMGDIVSGKPNEPCFCPIALATKRALGLPPYSTAIQIDGDVNDAYGDMLYDLPGEAMVFIRCFDRGLYVEPFTINVERCTEEP